MYIPCGKVETSINVLVELKLKLLHSIPDKFVKVTVHDGAGKFSNVINEVVTL
jgi:hypothetical protein